MTEEDSPQGTTTLGALCIGSRLMVRSQKNWRHGAISRIDGEQVVITVASPTGRSYRIRRQASSVLSVKDSIAYLPRSPEDQLHTEWCRYDARW
ncbi:MAG: hypothetical protein KF736_03680 [Acidobacteria bacterium]|nr:hypothetical protein [Acidobacteriota bacterium]MCW5949513.1 hypothetical protein [Pyrinomonadaceae bacterium]